MDPKTVIVICLAVFFLGPGFSNADDCNSCHCVFSNGSFYNLEPLASNNREPKYDVPFGNTSIYILYNPCKKFTIGEDCVDVSGCMQEEGPSGRNHTSTIGKQESAKWSMEYSHVNYTYGNQKFVVKLKCNGSRDDSSLTINEVTDVWVTAELESKCACLNGCPLPSGPPAPKKQGISTGTIIVIVFFVSVVVYLVGGVIYNKILHGATGKELIPNVEFWMAFPKLVLDGVAFVCNCCRKRHNSQSYDNM